MPEERDFPRLEGGDLPDKGQVYEEEVYLRVGPVRPSEGQNSINLDDRAPVMRVVLEGEEPLALSDLAFMRNFVIVYLSSEESTRTCRPAI